MLVNQNNYKFWEGVIEEVLTMRKVLLIIAMMLLLLAVVAMINHAIFDDISYSQAYGYFLLASIPLLFIAFLSTFFLNEKYDYEPFASRGALVPYVPSFISSFPYYFVLPAILSILFTLKDAPCQNRIFSATVGILILWASKGLIYTHFTLWGAYLSWKKNDDNSILINMNLRPRAVSRLRNKSITLMLHYAERVFDSAEGDSVHYNPTTKLPWSVSLNLDDSGLTSSAINDLPIPLSWIQPNYYQSQKVYDWRHMVFYAVVYVDDKPFAIGQFAETSIDEGQKVVASA